MNEQIRKLAEEAGFYFYDMHNVNGEDLGETIEADSWAAADKFAELIVQECIECVDGYTKPRTGNTDYDAVEQIKQHFGIK